MACAATVPKAVLDRCTLGNADGNDAFTMRQGPACREAAADLAADRELAKAVAYARKACSLEDAPGCDQYISLVREPSLSGEIPGARAAGEQACAGIVVASGGVDARPALCARTAQLYLDVEPKSPREAARLYARACDLGDETSCDRAKSLGFVLPTPPVPPAHSAMAMPAPPPAPPPARMPTCHDLRECVSLDVQQRNTTEILGTLTNHCNRAAFCSFCPARQASVDRSACRTVTIAPGESKSGREAGLWYDGYTAIAYDCSDAADDRSCTP